MASNLVFDESFASHEKSNYWSNKNKLEPEDVSISSNKIYLFNCDVCKHEFSKKIKDVVDNKWCVYCQGWATQNFVFTNLVKTKYYYCS
jgi:hypothetical protein